MQNSTAPLYQYKTPHQKAIFKNVVGINDFSLYAIYPENIFGVEADTSV